VQIEPGGVCGAAYQSAYLPKFEAETGEALMGSQCVL